MFYLKCCCFYLKCCCFYLKYCCCFYLKYCFCFYLKKMLLFFISRSQQTMRWRNLTLNWNVVAFYLKYCYFTFEILLYFIWNNVVVFYFQIATDNEVAKLDTGCVESLDSIKKLEIIKVGDNFCVNSLHDNFENSIRNGGEPLNLGHLSPVPPVLSDSPQRSLGQQTSVRKPNRRFGPKIPPPLTQKEAMENKENTKIQPEQAELSSLKISIPMIKKESKGKA